MSLADSFSRATALIGPASLYQSFGTKTGARKALEHLAK